MRRWAWGLRGVSVGCHMAANHQRVSEILERSRAALMRLDESTLMPPTVQRSRVIALTHTVLRSFQTVEPRLDNELSTVAASERRAQARTLEQRALTFFAADLVREENADRARNQGRPSPSATHARDLAWRAFTLWRNDYRALIATGRYMLRDSERARERFPSISEPCVLAHCPTGEHLAIVPDHERSDDESAVMAIAEQPTAPTVVAGPQ